jgi:hypothetical protein
VASEHNDRQLRLIEAFVHFRNFGCQNTAFGHLTVLFCPQDSWLGSAGTCLAGIVMCLEVGKGRWRVAICVGLFASCVRSVDIEGCELLCLLTLQKFHARALDVRSGQSACALFSVT